jgi:hypothetical protein
LTPAIEWLLFGVVTLALAVPCFWLPSIQAGDLASHVYNAWLANEIKQGGTGSLSIVPIWTNTLSDWLLEPLIRTYGPQWAERFVVLPAVLVFFWGAFAAGTAAAGRRPWILVPSLAMLTYGLIFHLGFLNYYLSAGLSMWVLALLWRPVKDKRRWMLAVPIAVLALLAHALPLAWAGVVLAYLRLAALLSPHWRLGLLAIFTGLLFAVRLAIVASFPVAWLKGQVTSVDGVAGLLGVEQVWLFGPKYTYVVAGLLMIWFALFLHRLDRAPILSDPVAGLWVLHMAAFALMPAAVQLPGYAHSLAFVPQRISLFTALCLCWLAGGVAHGKGLTRISVLVCALFFTFLYLDARSFDGVQRELEDVLKALRPWQRVAA